MTTDKPITITLTWYFKDYKVAATTNYVGHKPGDWVTPQEAIEMNGRPGWTVITVDNSLLQQITGAVIGAAAKSVTLPAL